VTNDEPVTTDGEVDHHIVAFYNDKVAIEAGDFEEDNGENYEFKDGGEGLRKDLEKEKVRIVVTVQDDEEEKTKAREEEQRRELILQAARKNFKKLALALRVVHCFVGILKDVRREREEQRRELILQAVRKNFKKLALAIRVVHCFLAILKDVRREREEHRLQLEERIEELEHLVVCPLTYEVREINSVQRFFPLYYGVFLNYYHFLYFSLILSR